MDGYERTVRLNLLAPMRLTWRLGPAMAARGEGLIINVASIAGGPNMLFHPDLHAVNQCLGFVTNAVLAT